MVTHDDLSNDQEYEEIKEDVRLECMDHGQVLSVVIPRLKDGYPASTEGHIYVEFTITECAKMAALALNGRKFADRTVVVQYVSNTNTLQFFPISRYIYISFFFSLYVV
jgi:splicing factor U2AF subunit